MTSDMCYDLFVHGDKSINYSTPRQIQTLKKREDTRWHSKKNKVCTATKGEHLFDQVETEMLFNRPWAKQYRCKCGKKGKREYIDPPEWLVKLSEKNLKTCSRCGKSMQHAIDPITKKKSKYLFYCPCNPDTILSVG